MKRYFYYLLFLFLPFCVFVGCNDPFSPEEELTPDPKPDPKPDTTTVFDKSKFEETAIEFMDEFNASDFENVMELAEYISNTYSEYETDEAEEWLDECLESLYIENDSSSEDYEIYEAIYRLSAFKGKFVAEDGRWVRSNSDNLSLHVKDQNRKPCVITLTTSGDTKRVFCFADEIYDEVYDENGYYNGYESVGEERVYVDVPEKITVVLTQDGKKLLEVVINTDLSSMKGDEFNLSKDKYNVSANLYFNGYTFDLKRVHYENNKESRVEFEFRHGSKVLLNSTLAVTPEILESAFEGDDFYEEDGPVDFRDNLFTVDILDKMQIKASCKDLQALLKVLDDEEDDENLDSKVNRHLDTKLYYEGFEEAVAEIKFESVEEVWYDGYRTYTDYDLIPVIVFNDGSRYSLEEYFNEEDFNKVIKAFDKLFKELEDLIYGYDIDF